MEEIATDVTDPASAAECGELGARGRDTEHWEVAKKKRRGDPVETKLAAMGCPLDVTNPAPALAPTAAPSADAESEDGLVDGLDWTMAAGLGYQWRTDGARRQALRERPRFFVQRPNDESETTLFEHEAKYDNTDGIILVTNLGLTFLGKNAQPEKTFSTTWSNVAKTKYTPHDDPQNRVRAIRWFCVLPRTPNAELTSCS